MNWTAVRAYVTETLSVEKMMKCQTYMFVNLQTNSA